MKKKIVALVMVIALIGCLLPDKMVCFANEPSSGNAADFITTIRMAPGIDKSEMVWQPKTWSGVSEVERDANCILWFDYQIGGNDGTKEAPVVGKEYSMDISGAIAVDTPFTVTGTTDHGATENIASGNVVTDPDTHKTKMNITFNQMAQDHGFLNNGTVGSFYVSANLDKNQIENTGRQTITIASDNIPDYESTIDFKITPVEPSVDITKSGQIDAPNHKVTWTITAVPQLANTYPDGKFLYDFKVTDILPDTDVPFSGVTYTAKDEDDHDVTAQVSYDESTRTLTYHAAKDGEEHVALKAITITVDATYTQDAVASYLTTSQKDEVKWTNHATATMKAPKYEKDGTTGAVVVSEDPDPIEKESDDATVSLKAATIDKKGAV